MGSTAAVMAFASPFPEDTAEEIEEATASNLALRPTKAAEMSVASARLEGSKGILDGTATTVEIRREISANARGENSIFYKRPRLCCLSTVSEPCVLKTQVDVDANLRNVVFLEMSSCEMTPRTALKRLDNGEVGREKYL